MQNFRIPIDLSSDDKNIRINLEQEFDSLDILTLKLFNSDLYPRQCSNFGVIVGRVMLNNGFGVQNAKVNIFIPLNEVDRNRVEITQIYPFETVNDTFPNGLRYNLLPRSRNNKNKSHRAVGSMPDITDFVHYPQYSEVYEKYYKYTTVTNESGDFMIFGVPVGQHTIVMDFDIFDTKSFDITANDLVQQQTLNNSINNINKVIDNINNDPNKVPGFIHLGNENYIVDVKTNIDEMPNIFHQTKQITVSPFWGDGEQCDIGITRCDFKIDFKYTPTAVFFGFIHSPTRAFSIDDGYNNINLGSEIYAKNLNTNQNDGSIYPSQKMEIVVYRLDDNLTPGSRKRLGVFKASEFNGVFRLILPMYMDYNIINEFGDLVPTSDTKNGLPTKGYYSFEIYDLDDSWTNRRSANGGFVNNIIPGVRIPSNPNGDPFLGGWEGTWGGLFEYDLKNKKRKFYTVKTLYRKHDINNVLLPGDFVSFFPKLNENKKTAFWNHPIHYDDINTSDPEIIGSILIPRVKTEFNGSEFKRPFRIVNESWKPSDETFNEPLSSWEVYLGVGTKSTNGLNVGDVFSELFKPYDYITNDNRNIFGRIPTWNYGDNTTEIFNPTLYANQLSKKPGSNANEFGVHKAFNQVSDSDRTFGVFINSIKYNNSEPILETYIYDITDELPNLISDGVYSSYNKGNLTSNESSLDDVISISDSINNSNTSNTLNQYRGKYYYFGLWYGANSLYDIENNYFINE